MALEKIDPARLARMGEWFAAGFFELPQAPPVVCMARGMRRHLERVAPLPWKGEPLYPSGRFDLWNQETAVYFHYSHSMRWNPMALEETAR